MELSNHVAPEVVEKSLQTSNSKPEPDGMQDSLQNIPPIEDAVSLLTSAHDLEPNDDLDARLVEGRRRRAKTFGKVTNLFNKIFAE